ncbi:keratin, type I cuticular Ha4 [Anolis carolinensis]|uniref:Keratin 36 n=1 Tax=Anolis carolinensis TaxID=28377 RepID=B6Z1W2_ANOCA|nr:keratin, type I cuticular Ha4 [Anolis carolinensis]ACI32632.1 keratin aHA1 [Anolis carolinensis]|eukprot:NP_001280052.1 keratin, type I cuticular Ha4 [Anolis carolinensis]
MAAPSTHTCGSLKGPCRVSTVSRPNSAASATCRPGNIFPRRSSICLPSLGQPTPSLPNSCRSGGFMPSTCLPPPSLGSTCVPPPCILPSARPLQCFPRGPEEGILNCNEKETMEFLNNRLGNYLERVRCLEQENAELEAKIREWYEHENAYVCTDFKPFYCTIDELQQQICCTKADNAKLCLDIDNLKMASDDYCTKYDYELSLRQRDECDSSGLRKVLDNLTLCRADLEAQLESLTEEMMCLKKNHEEESSALRSQLGDRINVEVDAAPSCNLNKVLDEMRCQYEADLEKNRREVEDWYCAQMEELNKEVISSGEQLQCCQTEIIETRRCVQTLEIELQAQQSMKSALETTLQETESRYCTQLAQLQCLISNVEAQLTEIRSDIERQNCDYKALLDEKARLDCEIAAYRNMLEGEDCKIPNRPCDPEGSTTVRSTVCRQVCKPEPICVPICPPDCKPPGPMVGPKLTPSCANPSGPVFATCGPPPCAPPPCGPRGPCGPRSPVCPQPCGPCPPGPRINTKICRM